MDRVARATRPSRRSVLEAYYRAERGGRPWRPSADRVRKMADDAEVGRVYREANLANLVIALERAYDPPVMSVSRSDVQNAANRAEGGQHTPRLDRRTITAMADAAEAGPPLDPADRYKAKHHKSW